PYTTAPANSTRALFPIDVRMEIEGGYLSLAQASAYFGIPFNVTYGISSNEPYYYSPNNNNVKALFTVTNPKSTAATVALAKAATADNVFDRVSITVDKIMINNVQLPGYAFTSTYFVDYGTSSDIVLESYAVNWNYNYYFDSYYGNIYSHAASIYNYPEMDVVTSPIDITKIYIDVANGYVWPIQFAHNEIKAYGPDGKEIKNLLNDNHYIAFSALTSKVAKLQEVILPFADVPVTYKARTIVTNGSNMMKYSVAFDITLGARPADKEIDLGTFNVPGSQSHSTQIPVTPIAKAVAADAAAFANLPVFNSQNYANVYNTWNQWNFVEAKNTDGLTLNYVCYDLNSNYTAFEDKAYLEVRPNANYGATYDLKETYEFYGIKYTFKAKVNYQQPGYKLVANPKFVKNGVVDLTGSVTYPLFANKNYTDAVKYALDKIDLRAYVNVEGESVADKLNKELKIAYTVDKTVFDYGTYQNRVPYGVSAAEPSTVTVYAYEDQNKNYVEVLPENILTWDNEFQYKVDQNTWDLSSTINEVQVTYQLLSSDGKVKFGEPVTLKLVVPELLKLETTKTLSEPWENNDAPTVTNIYKALKITDTKSKAQISNPNATKAGDFFDYVYTENKQTVTKAGVRNVYDITVVPDAANVKIYLKSGAPLNKNDYEFDPETGDVQLASNTGNITEDVIIEIPVAMYHMYQGNHAHNVTVKVEFKK
ncbi:MAG: hypothetical protein IJ971_01950, partial [Bacteroidales bacterium]|nr:hypothetical protein [Bacteroidales bacterium]